MKTKDCCIANPYAKGMCHRCYQRDYRTRLSRADRKRLLNADSLEMHLTRLTASYRNASTLEAKIKMKRLIEKTAERIKNRANS